MNRRASPPFRSPSVAAPSRRRNAHERGSALLIVFVFAAIVAIMLYTEMPVAVFEARRQKEQLLIDRGKQYAQAVRLFVRGNRGQYPPNIEALEKTNQVRYLRARYKDPFTGKDDWRLLHAGPNGMLIDSKVQQAAPSGPGAANANNGGQSNTGLGAFSGNAPGGGVNASLQNTISSAASASLNSFGNQPPGNAGAPGGGTLGGSGGWGNRTGTTSNFGGFFSSPTATSSSTNSADGQGSANAKGDNPFSAAAQRAPTAVSNTGSAATDSAAAPDSQNAGGDQPLPTLPRSRRTANTGSGPGDNADPNATPAGMPDSSAVGPNGLASNPQYTSSGPSGQSFNRGMSSPNAPAGGGGFGNTVNPGSSSQAGRLQNANLAGVASKADGLSIKTVNEQEAYQLWEFFYDPTKDPMRGTGAVAGSGNPNAGNPNAINPGAGNANGNGGVQSGQGSGFGGFNNSGGFNNNGGFNNRGAGNSSFGNSTINTGSQAPPINPSMNQTMSTSSNPR